MATSMLVATRAEMETALAAEEMKKSRRSMEVSSFCFDAFNADVVRVDVGNVNEDAVATIKASGATNFIVTVCFIVLLCCNGVVRCFVAY